MANEAVLRDRLEHAINFTCADGTAIEKGTLLKLTDPRTASASDGAGDVLAGIAMEEKEASNGITSIGVIRKGIFDMYCSGACPVGAPVMSAGVDNEVKIASGNASGAAILGYMLEAGADTETAQVFVDIGGGF